MVHDPLSDSLDRIVSHVLRTAPHLAPDVAAVARWLADVADRVAAEGGHARADDDPRSIASTLASTGTSAPAASGSSARDAGAPLTNADPSPALTQPTPTATPSQPGVPLSSGFVPIRLGDQVHQIRVSGTSKDIAAARFSAVEQARPPSQEPVRRVPDPALIADRCDLKAEGCRAFIERRAAAGTPAEYDAVGRINAIVDRGRRLPDCFIWMVFPGRTQPQDDHLRLCAHVYETLAKAARLCVRVQAGSPVAARREALELLAEAQSSLRVCIERTWLTRPDMDQEDAFAYLRDCTTHERVFIERYMRIDDPPDPEGWEDLAARIARAGASIDRSEQTGKRARSLLSTVRHHARQVLGNPDADHEHDWNKMEDALRALHDLGVDASGREVADAVGAARELIPANAARPMLTAAAGVGSDDEDEAPAREYSDRVRRVRAVLEGQRIVIVGGEKREDAIARYADAFGCEVEWVELSEHGSSTLAQAAVTRPGTRAVFHLIKLTGHQHTEDVSRYCQQANVPVIRLPAGYNPEQAAAQLVEQASVRFGLEGVGA